MYWHLTLAAVGRINLFPTREERLAAARTVVNVEAPVLLWCAVDDHLHLVVEGEHLGHLGGALRRRLARRGPVQPAHIKPVEGRRHLVTLVDYLLRQPAKHDLDVHPALWEGSCFPDLVRARRMGFDGAPLERALPRRHHRDFLTPVGLRRTPAPLPWEAVRGVGLSRMAGAVRCSAGLDALTGPRTAERVEARRALAWMAHRVDVPTKEVAALLDIHPRSARRGWEEEEPTLCRTARAWLDLETLCGRNQG